MYTQPSDLDNGRMARLMAELMGVCRSYFRDGVEVEAAAALTGLDIETVKRVHDVHLAAVSDRTRSAS